MTTIVVTMIVATILLTIAFASTPSFPSAQNMTDGSVATTTTENMTGDNDSDGENAAEMNDSGSVSSFHDGCPFSFC
ncbi:MAG: hypothetical protein WB815_05835 [Nitrososphaeraceae archaeon]